MSTRCHATRNGYVCERRSGHAGRHQALMGLYPKMRSWDDADKDATEETR